MLSLISDIHRREVGAHIGSHSMPIALLAPFFKWKKLLSIIRQEVAEQDLFPRFYYELFEQCNSNFHGAWYIALYLTRKPLCATEENPLIRRGTSGTDIGH